MDGTRTAWFYRWNRPVRTGWYECLYGSSNAPRLLRWDGTCFVDKHGRDWIVTYWRGLTKEAAERIERTDKWYANTYNRPTRISEMEPSDMDSSGFPTNEPTAKNWAKWAMDECAYNESMRDKAMIAQAVGNLMLDPLTPVCRTWMERTDIKLVPNLTRGEADMIVKHYQTRPLAEEFRFVERACNDTRNIAGFAATPGFHAMLQRIASYWRGVNRWH